MPEHLHAEGIDGVLQQRQRLVDRLRAVLANQVQRLFQRGGHPIRLADTRRKAKSQREPRHHGPGRKSDRASCQTWGVSALLYQLRSMG